MGHDIVRQFESRDPGQAAVEIAAHLKRFWEPRMLEELVSRVQAGEPGIPPLLAAAAHHLA